MDICIGKLLFKQQPDGDYKLAVSAGNYMDFGGDQMQAMLAATDYEALNDVRIIINGVSFIPEGRRD